MVDSPKENINIQLGDIIQLIAPDSEKFNQQQFYIKYIDSSKIELINVTTDQISILKIDDGQFDDPSIESIELLNRADHPGYAKQNNLVPGIWINIYFRDGGGVPFIVTGLISNLEEDSIEITTYPENDIIYIDFEYKGLPENLPIEKIVITSEPKKIPRPDDDELHPVEEDTESALAAAETEAEEIDADEFGKASQEESGVSLNQLIVDADEIEIGDDLDEIEQIVDVKESEKRFSIEKQTDDLLDELLSEIPNYKRSFSVLNKIHTMIERFVQLREIYSNFDSNNNANIPDKLDANYKPIIDSMVNFEKNYRWLLPVSYNKKKLYISEQDLEGVDPVNLIDSLEEELQLISIDKDKTFDESENKFLYLARRLNKFITPFIEPIETTDNITTQRVKANILSVVDNLENLSSYVATISQEVKANKPIIKYLLLETYTTGLDYIKDGVLAHLTHSDSISIKSILSLTIGELLYSQIDLPTTSILDKTQLSRINFDYYKILNKDTSVRPLTIDNFDMVDEIKPRESSSERLEYESDGSEADHRITRFKETFLREIRQYILDEDLYDDSDKYRKFLNMVIPSNSQIFGILKNYISNPLSVYSVIKLLEVLNIYHRDVTDSLYKEIVDFTEQCIIDYKAQFSANYKQYSKLTVKKELSRLTDNILDILSTNSALETIVLDAYNFKKDGNYSNSEILKKMISIDSGRLFSTAIIKINLELQESDLVDNFVKKYERVIKEQRLEKNTCKIISKKYLSTEELESDNKKPVYFDAQYDKTNYKLLDKLRDEQESVEPEEFKKLLIELLVKNKKINIDEATKEVDTLIVGKKLVENGDYAIVILNEPNADSETLTSTEYYVRKDDVWERDKELVGDVNIKDNKLFCDLQKDCINRDDKCENLGAVENKINEETLQAIYKEFDETYNVGDIELKDDVEKNLLLSIHRIALLKNIESIQFFKYDKEKRDLGNSIIDDEAMEDLIISPYEKLRDIILGQTDIVKKQYDIQKFASFFTRQPYSTDDKYWLYCVKTNTKLLPTFLGELADVYMNSGDYLLKLDVICTEQGTISEDGDAWIDKHSGYVIKKIDFDTEEGFTEEGFKLKTRDIMEADLVDVILASTDDKAAEKESGESKKIRNVVKAVTSSMGINLSKSMEFIISNVIATHNSNKVSEEQYNTQIDKLKLKGKTNFATYENVINESYMILTLIYILIAIQINIPDIKTRTNFPGCIKSFAGYPFDNDNKSGITYLACVVHKMKSSIEPWNSISKINVDGIIKRMERIINTFKIAKQPDIIDRIKEKVEYLKTTKLDITLVSDDSRKLGSFFPPLVPFTIQRLNTVSASFKKDLLKNLQTGNPQQQEQILTVKSKIIEYGLAIQEHIQKIVIKNLPLITNNASEPFLENSCCDSELPNIYKYLVDIDSLINTYNDTVTSLDEVVNIVTSLSMAPLFYDRRDTKYKFPEVDSYFSKDTIYRAFVVFCKNKDLELSDDLVKACQLEPEDYLGEETIESKIERLKEEGINYDEALLQKLLALVNLKNSLKLDLTISLPNPVQKLRDVLDDIETDKVANRYVPAEFVILFRTLLDRYSLKQMLPESEELRQFKNYLAIQNNALSTRLEEFIAKNLKLDKAKFEKFKKCYTNITNFVDAEQSMYKMMNFINNSIRNIADVFPNIVINKMDFDDVHAPTHWNLSIRHEMDIRRIIRNYYVKLKQFYDDKSLDIILKDIQNLATYIKLLAKNTPYYAPFSDGEDDVKSIFDQRLVSLLFKYYFLLIINNYISIFEEITTGVVKKSELTDSSPTTKLVGDELEELQTAIAVSATGITIEEREDDPIVVQAAILGDQKVIATLLSKYIVTIMEIVCEDKDVINYDSSMIMNKILRAKEKEKNIITDMLQNMTDEERAVEKHFKNHKLGKWGKGLQKGLTQYVQETYDEEREEMDKQEIKDRILAETDGVVAQNKNIYQDDLENDGILQEEIDQEVYDLTEYGGEDDNADEGEYSDEGY